MLYDSWPVSVQTAAINIFFIVGVLSVTCDNKPQIKRVMACCKTFLSLCTEQGEVSLEGGRSSWVQRNSWGRGGVGLQKHSFFYFCTIVPLILCFNKNSVLPATKHITVYWKIFYGPSSLLEYKVIENPQVSWKEFSLNKVVTKHQEFSKIHILLPHKTFHLHPLKPKEFARENRKQFAKIQNFSFSKFESGKYYSSFFSVLFNNLLYVILNVTSHRKPCFCTERK